MKLDVGKVKELLKKDHRPHTWLALQMGVSRSLLQYHLANENPLKAEEIAIVLGCDPRDLVIFETEAPATGTDG